VFGHLISILQYVTVTPWPYGIVSDGKKPPRHIPGVIRDPKMLDLFNVELNIKLENDQMLFLTESLYPRLLYGLPVFSILLIYQLGSLL